MLLGLRSVCVSVFVFLSGHKLDALQQGDREKQSREDGPDSCCSAADRRNVNNKTKYLRLDDGPC